MEELIDLLTCKNDIIDFMSRDAAAKSLSKINDSRVIPALIEAIEEVSCIPSILGAMPDDTAKIYFALQNSQWEVLKNLGSKAIPILIQATHHKNEKLQKKALSGLGKIHNPDGLSTLLHTWKKNWNKIFLKMLQ